MGALLDSGMLQGALRDVHYSDLPQPGVAVGCAGSRRGQSARRMPSCPTNLCLVDVLLQNMRAETLQRTAEADIQTGHGDAPVAGHLTPVALLEVHLNEEPPVRLGQLHYFMPD